MCSARAPTTPAARHTSAGSGSTARRSRITLTRPSPDFLKRLSLPYFAPLPAGVPNVAGGAPDHPPPAAGPYYAAEFINGEYMLLKRNPYYRGPRPHALDAIVLREGIDAARAIERVRDGTLDGVTLADPLLTPAGARHARRCSPRPASSRSTPAAARSPRRARAARPPTRSRAARSRPSGT